MQPIRQSVEHVSTAAEEHIHEHGDYVASPTATITRHSARFHKATPPAEHQDLIHNLQKIFEGSNPLYVRQTPVTLAVSNENEHSA